MEDLKWSSVFCNYQQYFHERKVGMFRPDVESSL